MPDDSGTIRISGGEKLQEALEKLTRNLFHGQRADLRVGFLAKAKYPNGMPVAMVALFQDFGTKNIPPRPFFRNMVKDKSPQWGKQLAAILSHEQYDLHKSLDQMGQLIAGQLRQSIIQTNSPPLAASTIARKGFAKPLVDTGHMLNSIDHEIKN